MTAQLVSDTHQDHAQQLDVALVSKSFVKQYYWILNERSDLLHQFYGPDSTVVVSESLGGEAAPYVVEARNPEDICQLLPHLFGQVVVTLTELLPQRTLGGSVMVMVTGRMVQELWTEERCFTQVFLLARQPTGYYIRTDTLQVHNPTETSQMLKGMRLKAPAHETPEIQDVQHQVSVNPSEDEQEQDTVEAVEQVECAAEYDTCVDDVPPVEQDEIDEVADPKVKEDEPVVVQSPRTPTQAHASPNTEEVQSAKPGEKKSFLEVVIGSGKKEQSPTGGETSKAKKVPPAAGNATGKVPTEELVKSVPPAVESPKPMTVKETATKALNQAPVQTVKINANKEVAEDGKDFGHGRGRGKAPQPGFQGRGGNGKNGGRGYRLARNPSTELPGDGDVNGNHTAKGEDRNHRTVFVGQLPFGQKVETIHSAFSSFGRILGGTDGITVRTGQTHSFAFVVFEDAASARKALEGTVKLDGEELAIKPYAPRDRLGMRERGDIRGRRGGLGARGNGRSVNGTQDGWKSRGDWVAPRDRFAPKEGGSPTKRDTNRNYVDRRGDSRRVPGVRPNYGGHHRGVKERGWDRTLVQPVA